MRTAFAADGERATRLSRAVRLDRTEVVLDFSKNLPDGTALALLRALAEARGLRARIDAMFAGERINTTEGRAVLGKQLATQLDRALLDDRNDGLDASTAALIGHWRKLNAG